MAEPSFVGTTWNNGRHAPSGAGYGVKLNAADRDRHFDRMWTNVTIVLPQGRSAITVNVAKRSFWDPTCRELIHQGIGRWLLASGLAPWPKRKPPKLRLTPIGPQRFRLSADTD